MKNYDNLYLDILTIGRETVQNGISYNELKQKLGDKGYDFSNDCIELAVKQWFFDSFHHRDEDDNPITCVHQIEEHLDCSFILKGESCLMLIDHRKAKRNLGVAWLSFAAALLSIAYSLVHDFYSDRHSVEKRYEKVKVSEDRKREVNSNKNVK